MIDLTQILLYSDDPICSIYHAFCEIDTYRERKNSVLNGLIITRPALWLEENVIPGKIENVFEWPCRTVIEKIIDSTKKRTNNQNMVGILIVKNMINL